MYDPFAPPPAPGMVQTMGAPVQQGTPIPAGGRPRVTNALAGIANQYALPPQITLPGPRATPAGPANAGQWFSGVNIHGNAPQQQFLGPNGMNFDPAGFAATMNDWTSQKPQHPNMPASSMTPEALRAYQASMQDWRGQAPGMFAAPTMSWRGG